MECPICYDTIPIAQQFEFPICQHSFCDTCIYYWFQLHSLKTCPICRATLYPTTTNVIDIESGSVTHSELNGRLMSRNLKCGFECVIITAAISGILIVISRVF
uniref:RING-type domain-containing protein n=1 Tax=viral metagenome TaxID=1070528 RepID=A0A6C0CQR2_9ZZZZ